MKPSVTFWHRLEPRPRAPEIADSLAARLRDPLWLIARQWQLGEIQGEDAGSPAFAQLDLRVAPVRSWRLGKDAPLLPLDPGRPLEDVVESEEITPDLSLRVELGQTFESLLEAAGAGSLVAAFRTAFPLPDKVEDGRDAEAARFLDLCRGRALDGVLLHHKAKEAAGGLPPVDPALKTKVEDAVRSFQSWIEDVFGTVGGPAGGSDAPAWHPERLEYQAEVVAGGPGGNDVVLAAHPGRNADFDWYAFDQSAAGGPAGTVSERPFSVFPGHVRFRGMPNARWWDFETSVTDFGAIETQKRDLAKLMVMDFMLIHSNDWFLVPLEQEVGSISWLESLLVHDVFGGVWLIDRADAEPVGSPGERWSMFSTAVADKDGELARFFVLPASPAAAIQTGEPIEEVRLFRDEMAEMVWAVERTTENGIGAPWSGHERSLAGRKPEPAPPPGEGAPPLRYQIQTEVPEHWIPFLPVSLDPLKGEIALEKAAMIRPTGELVRPAGRILQPAAVPYHVAEEEVPRAGTSVVRLFCRSRWIDGSTHLWIARRKTAGAGEGSSGLRYDLAAPNR